jgi:hypothetical protein
MNKSKKYLSERLGVTDNIGNTAKEVYDIVYGRISDDFKVGEITNFQTSLYGDFKVGEITTNLINITLNIKEHSKFLYLGMSIGYGVKVTKNFKIKAAEIFPMNIKIRFAGPKTIKGSDIKNFMLNEKGEMISSIAHEIKHAYDNYKKDTVTIKDRVRYEVMSNSSFANIVPINDFIYFLYYSHIIESLVRPTEIATLMDINAITKKQFVNFLMNNKTYNNLKRIREFTYEGFIEDIKKNMSQIKKTLDDSDIDYSSYSNDEIIKYILKTFYKNLVNWHSNGLQEYISYLNPMGGIFGFSDEELIFMSNYNKDISRFGNDYEKFFRYEIKKANRSADLMMRKLSKLYDLAL